MTRETKVGLVVAGSFLCLVCVVVASKLNGDDPAGPSTNFADAAKKNGGVADPEESETKVKPNGEKLQQSVPAPVPTPRDKGGSPLPLNTVPPGEKTPEQMQKELEEKIKRQKKENDKLQGTPAPMGPNPSFGSASQPDGQVIPPPIGAQPNDPPGLPMPAPVGVGQPKPAQIASSPNGMGDQLPMPAPLPQSRKDDPLPMASQVGGLNPVQPLAPAPAPPLPNGNGPMEPGVPLPLPAPVNPFPKDSFSVNNDGQGPVMPKGNKGPNGLGPDPVAPPIGPVPVVPPPSAVSPPSVPPGLPAVGVNPQSQPSGLPPAGLGNAPSLPPSLPPTNLNPPAPAPMGPPPSVPQPFTAPGPIPTIGSIQQLPSTQPITMTEPRPALPNPMMPAIPAGGFPSSSPVRTTDPDIVKVLPGETNFAQLSGRLYNTDKYAAALQQFNKDYWDAVQDPSLAAAQPVLRPDQKVMHPPIGVLETRYPNLIGSGTPSPVAPPVIGTLPPAAGSLPPVRAIPVVPSAAPAPTTPGFYVVQTAGGEGIRDIARRVLGNADRWTDLYRANPTLQPQFAIPQGTQLKLP